MRPQDILMPVPAGLCCKPGGFHIDPVRPVERGPERRDVMQRRREYHRQRARRHSCA